MRRSIKNLLALLATATLFMAGGCTAYGLYYVTGEVTDEAGEPIEGLEVICTTDEHTSEWETTSMASEDTVETRADGTFECVLGYMGGFYAKKWREEHLPPVITVEVEIRGGEDYATQIFEVESHLSTSGAPHEDGEKETHIEAHMRLE